VIKGAAPSGHLAVGGAGPWPAWNTRGRRRHDEAGQITSLPSRSRTRAFFALWTRATSTLLRTAIGRIKPMPHGEDLTGPTRQASSRASTWCTKDRANTLRKSPARREWFLHGQLGAGHIASSQVWFLRVKVHPRAGRPGQVQAARDGAGGMRLLGFHIVSRRTRSGGVVICEILNVLEGHSVRDRDTGTPARPSLQIESDAAAYARTATATSADRT